MNVQERLNFILHTAKGTDAMLDGTIIDKAVLQQLKKDPRILLDLLRREAHQVHFHGTLKQENTRPDHMLTVGYHPTGNAFCIYIGFGKDGLFKTANEPRIS